METLLLINAVNSLVFTYIPQYIHYYTSKNTKIKLDTWFKLGKSIIDIKYKNNKTIKITIMKLIL